MHLEVHLLAEVAADVHDAAVAEADQMAGREPAAFSSSMLIVVIPGIAPPMPTAGLRRVWISSTSLGVRATPTQTIASTLLRTRK